MKLPQFDEDLSIKTDRYRTGNLAVSLVNDVGEPYGRLSVNVEGVELDPGEFVFKTYAENRGMYEALLSQGVVQPTGKTVEVGRAGPQPVVRLRG